METKLKLTILTNKATLKVKKYLILPPLSFEMTNFGYKSS